MSHHFTSVEFENLGPIKKATLALTRLHALIGPNDSGKSWTLKGLRYAAALARQSNDFRADTQQLAATMNGFRISFAPHVGWEWRRNGTPVQQLDQWVHDAWTDARVLRLDPDFLRAPRPLLTDEKPLDFANERGEGLGALLDAISARSRKSFIEIERAFVEMFPTTEEFSLSTTAKGRRVGIKLKSGATVGPEHMSEGMLYFLAFAVLPYLSPFSILLVEEPENGLHPSRIADVVRILRKVSETTQVVMATHSPLVVNELQPEEVTLVTRTEAGGTKFTPIAQTVNFAQRSKTYALGELWLSYADGKDEAPLFKTGSGA